MRASRVAGLAAATALALTITACSGQPAAGDAATEAPAEAAAASEIVALNPASADAFPVTVTHAFGETTINEKPERIATVAWANHEVPLALGVQPVIFEKATWGDADGDGMLPWVTEKVDELGFEPNMYDPTDGIDFQAVADAQPDVILAAYSGLTQEDYDRLTKIAPVVAFPEVAWGTSYAEMIELNSTALGLQAEGETLLAELDSTVKAALEKHPDIVGKKQIFLSFTPEDLSTITYYSGLDTRPKFLAEYGLPDSQLAADATSSSDAFFGTISAEEVDKFADVDVVISYGEPEQLAQLQADPLLSKIPAIAEGRVMFAGAENNLDTGVNPTPLSIPSTIDAYFAALEKAIAGNK